MIWAKESASSKKETVGLIWKSSPEKFPFVVLWNLRRGFCNWIIFVATGRLNFQWNSLLRSCAIEVTWYATLHMGWPLWKAGGVAFQIHNKAATMTSRSTESFHPKESIYLFSFGNRSLAPLCELFSFRFWPPSHVQNYMWSKHSYTRKMILLCEKSSL